MKEREKYENGLLTLRFTGKAFNERGVSIYDLGNTLLATQRIMHKAYLSQEGRLIKGAVPNREEREALSLQLGERKRASDAFALIPIISDPLIAANLKIICEYVISGIVGYYVGDVLDRLRGEKSQEKRIFIGSIYTEVANIVNRIDASGQVEGISIGSPLLGRETFAAFDAGTKDYLSAIRDEYYLGPYQEIRGGVYKLYPKSKIVAIKRSGGTNVDIFLSEENFNKIRYHQERNPIFIFKGHPKFHLGIEGRSVSEFVADNIEYVGN